MATSNEMSRINRILERLKKFGDMGEFEIKTHFKLGVSTYNSLKREVRLSPIFSQNIEIISKRGEADVWKLIKHEPITEHI